MSKIFQIAIWLISFISFSSAQPYGNEWIEYDKTYYKFNVGTTQFYRIPYATLITVFAPEDLVGSHFKLITRGKEVPLFTSTDGVFSASDYIEFYGIKNDGEFDKDLYKPNQNLHELYSLVSDNIGYFLTLDDQANNRRFITKTNNPAGLTAEPYFWFTSRFLVTTNFIDGEPLSGFGDLSILRDSRYSNGEGYAGPAFSGPNIRNRTLNTPFAYRADANLQAKLRHVHICLDFSKANNITLTAGTSSFNYSSFGYRVRKAEENIPLTNVGATSTIVGFREANASRVTDALIEIEYPRLFSFSAASIFAFEVENTAPTLLEITDFNAQSTVPVLYDLNNNERYLAIVNGNQYRFGLNSSVIETRNFVLTNQNASNFASISALESIEFVNYNESENQGDYLIIGHQQLYTSDDNTNYIEAYKNYRSTPEGGNFTAIAADIFQLENQFGWGIRNHPLAIRNFVNFAIDEFMVEPQHLFIIGKGIEYDQIRTNATNFNNTLIPAMGEPASDVSITQRNATNETPQLSVGRLAATNGNQVAQYLEKIVEYESAYNDTMSFSQTIEQKEWMKRILHLGGGKNIGEQDEFKNYLRSYEQIAEAPLFGGEVTSVFKTSTEPIEISTSLLVDSLVDNGISLITFFGHSTTSTIDFDISPEEFQNVGRYHTFLSNGCFVGSIFDPALNNYSNRFIFQNRIGSVAYIAPITLALPSSLNFYSNSFYTRFSRTQYGAALGTLMKDVTSEMINEIGGSFTVLLAKQMILHGDPAIKLNPHNRPDYAITKASIEYNPTIVSASSDSFEVQIAVTNIGKAVDAEYNVRVQRTFPNGEISEYAKRLPAAYFRDTVIISIPTDRLIGLGTNILRIKVDSGDEIDELSELNNEVVDSLVIFADDIIPILPYEYCIVNAIPDKIYFSTASISETPKNYILQIDTTEYFNSPLFTEQNISSTGGIVEWSPNITYLENVVYYIRSTLDTIILDTYNWQNSSFLFNTSLSTGWSQSHFFQFLNDDFFTLNLEEPDRKFKYPTAPRELRLINGVVGRNGFVGQDNEAFLDGNLLIRNSLSKASINFFVFDPATGKYFESIHDPDFFPTVPTTTFGNYGDLHPAEFPAPRPILNFLIDNDFWTAQVFYFLRNSLPENAIILAFTTQEQGLSFNTNLVEPNDFLEQNGETGQNFFTAMESIGATQIRQLANYKQYIFFTQLDNPDFPTLEYFVDGNEKIDTTFNFDGLWNAGALRSVKIGPSIGWNSLEFEVSALEEESFDDFNFNISGVDTAGVTRVLAENITETAYPLTAINADQYPHLKLEWITSDDSARTAPQLDYWRVLFDKVPEAAVDPQLNLFASADSIDIGQEYRLSAGIRNISDIGMDSLLVKVILNKGGSAPISTYKRFAPLPAGQSLIADFTITSDLIIAPGVYSVLLEANPDNDQPEQFHFNNYASFTLVVNDDKINPLLDVTFDGVHILDGDIINPRPEILIKLKDENLGLALNDTSLIEFFIYYPNNPNLPVRINPNDENVNFVPASENNLDEKNEALLYYYPNFEVDGIYRLKVQGEDARNNAAGDYDYLVSFEVINESSISNFMNYPNPFSNATKFVFTITGAEIPDFIKIQIMTVSGKVVREITQDELGPLKIGRNITDFTWDGTDRYGDPLANGLYIYKVFTKINGESIEQYETSADKFFKKDGFGKMYIVR